MAKEEITPSEWQIMEVLWACREPMTSSGVCKRMQGTQKDEQIKELEDILEKSRDRGTESADKEGGSHA